MSSRENGWALAAHSLRDGGLMLWPQIIRPGGPWQAAQKWRYNLPHPGGKDIRFWEDGDAKRSRGRSSRHVLVGGGSRRSSDRQVGGGAQPEFCRREQCQ